MVNLLLQDRKFYDLETWHGPSRIPGLQSLHKLYSWVDLQLFYGKVKFGLNCLLCLYQAKMSGTQVYSLRERQGCKIVRH